MKTRSITSLREFDELRPLWREVTEAAGQSSLLLSHDWFASCWRTAGPNRTRELWIVEDAAGPAALIPLVGTKMRYRGLPTRVLQLMHPPDAPVVDFPAARDPQGVMRALLERLQSRDDWDLFLIPGLPSDSSKWKAFQSVTSGQLRWRIADRLSIPSLSLTEGNPQVRATLDRLRQSVAATRSRRLDTVVVEQHRTLDARGPLFEEIMGVTRRRAQSTATLPETTAEEVRRFYRELTGRASANGWLSLWVLRYEGRVVEVEYQLTAEGFVHSVHRDADQSPAELRLDDVLSLAILEALLTKPTAHTYHRTPVRNGDGGSPGAGGRESLFVEAFASRVYPQLLHRLEARILPFARRLGGRPSGPAHDDADRPAADTA